MTYDEVMDACAAFPATELDHPFGDEVPVFKVVGKVFAILGESDRGWRLTLKADPEDARALVDTYRDVAPGYHMNKKHWITVTLPADDVPVTELIRDSYELVVATLPRDQRPTPSA